VGAKRVTNRSNSRNRGTSKTIEQRGARIKDFVSLNQMSIASPTSMMAAPYQPYMAD